MTPATTLASALTARSFRAIGTTATVLVEDPDAADLAEHMLARELEALDLACSRFRPDSELQRLHEHAGETVAVGALLFQALEVACDVAARTAGAVDPTVGNALATLGYDRDFDEVLARPPAAPRALGPVVGFAHVHLNPSERTVRIPRGVRLDLGSTAKALGADRAAARIASSIGAGALVSLGGDIAVAGPPPRGGWPVGIARESSAAPTEVEQVVAIRHGGLASSAASARTWAAGSRTVHHIVDPRTGDCAATHWVLVSATGRTCVEANLVTTAAMVWGAAAMERLAAFGQSVRLVRTDGQVFTVNGWPLEHAA